MTETRSARPPALPERDSLPEREHEAYDFMMTRVRGSEDAQVAVVAGKPYGAVYFSAIANTPVVGAALARLGQAAMGLPDRDGTLSAADHEIIDAVLAFDSGHTFLLAGHGPLAIRAGVRLEALEAIRDGREDELTNSEKQQVEFIRAVRDGAVTDDIWSRMVERLGSERGAIEYAFFVCLVLLNHLFAAAMGVPGMTAEELKAMFDSFHDGRETVTYADYAKIYGDATFEVRE